MPRGRTSPRGERAGSCVPSTPDASCRVLPAAAPEAAAGNTLKPSGPQVEAVSVHDLRPCRDEVLNELLQAVILRIDLGVRA